MTGSGRTRRSRAPKGEGERLRDQILAATERLLLHTGDESAVSIRGIAEAVGVTAPSIYLHFADKEELLQAVCQRRFGELDARIEAEVRGIHDPVEALRRRAHAYIGFGVEHPEHYRILFMARHGLRHTPTRGELEESAADLGGFGHLISNVRACMEVGAFAPADPLLVATGLWTVVHGITSLRITMPHFAMVGDDVLVDHVLEAVARGLAPR
ncbi:MAG: TetR/AcrR family transcriptional regulator [Actinomycetota bacterium]|nr:TetR/AcrR family transcriptional regulator [Actinomycetota bacterium]